jgi:D-lactate dehydrogenase (cytochrome)
MGHTPEERTRLWTARHNAYFAAVQSRPGCRCITTDTCVPISRLADCLLDSVAEADASRASPTSWSAMWATATSTSAT